MPGALLKLLVKDKLPHRREVPMNTKEWQLAEPPRREKALRLKQMSTNQHERLAAETPRAIKIRVLQYKYMTCYIPLFV